MSDNLPEGCVPFDQVLPAPPVKPVGSIEIELPDGRKIVMSKPKMSLSDKIAGVMANFDCKNPAMFEMERNRIKCLLFIESIAGEPVIKISEPIGRAALEQQIGDEHLDGLLVTWLDNFPPTDPGSLKVVKR